MYVVATIFFREQHDSMSCMFKSVHLIELFNLILRVQIVMKVNLYILILYISFFPKWRLKPLPLHRNDAHNVFY